MDKFIGKRLDGRYEIKELIGVGGMAVVYKAYDNIDDRIVSIKILKEEFLANEEFRRRFKNESKAIAVLSQPNIVKVYDVSFGDILQYIVMEYIEGITLKTYIEQQGVIDWREAMHFTVQILKALHHAHEKGIVHRDIKPQNVLLQADGTIKVTDFGIARFSRSEQRTITDKAIGSVHYISPEQARGDFTDGKADIYSVGVLLYEMITGRVPFQADSAVSVAIMQLQNEPVHPSEINNAIPKGLEEITLKSMQKEPNNRYPTAQSMLSELNILKQDPTVTFNHEYYIDSAPTRHVEIRENAKKGKDTNSKPPLIPILTGVATVLVIFLILGSIWFFNFINPSSNVSECPEFVGLNYNDILDDKEKYGKYNFLVSDENFNYNNDYATGIIYDQEPDPGSKIKDKSEIQLFISKGPKSIKLKNYMNYDYTTVYEELDGEGLKVIKVEMSHEKIQKGYVISTYPSSDLIVRYGDEVTVYVSLGQDKIIRKLPNLIGMTEEKAKDELERSGFRLGKVTEVEDKIHIKGIVVKQEPKAGDQVELGSAIQLFVSKGAPVTTELITRDVAIDVPLPDINDSVELSVWVDGVLQENRSVRIDLTQTSSYRMTVTGKNDRSKVMFKINDKNYIEYLVDFQKQIYTVLNKYELNGSPFTNPQQTTTSERY